VSWHLLMWEVARAMAATETPVTASATPDQCATPDYAYGPWEKTGEDRWYEGTDVMQRVYYKRTVTDNCTGEESTESKAEGPFRLWQAVPDKRVADVNRPAGSDQALSGTPLRSSDLPGGAPQVGPSLEPAKSAPVIPASSPVPGGSTPFLPSLALLVGLVVAAFKNRWAAVGHPGEEMELVKDRPLRPVWARAGKLSEEDRRALAGEVEYATAKRTPEEAAWIAEQQAEFFPAGGRPGSQADRLKAAGFTDEAIAVHGVETLIALLNHHEKNSPPSRLPRVVKEMNVWARNVASGQAEQDRKFVDRTLSLGLSVAPGIGEVKDAQEALTGVDYLTGEELATWERWVTVGAFALPMVGGKAIRELVQGTAKGAAGAVDELSDIARHGDEAVEVGKQAVRQADDVAETLHKTGQFGRESFASLRAFGTEAAKYLPAGLPMAEFQRLLAMPTDKLTDQQIQLLMEVRNKVPSLQRTTVMQKIVPAKYLPGFLSGTVTGVGGCMSRMQDVVHLRTSDDIFNGLVLDYPKTPFKLGEPVYAVRFQADPNLVKTAYGGNTEQMLDHLREAHGLQNQPLTKYDPPFTGHGFLGTSEHIIPEYRAFDPVPFQDGDEIYRIGPDGVEELVAVFSSDAGKFIEV
jgi:hypothetical protein